MNGDSSGGAVAAPDPEERNLLRRLQDGVLEDLARLVDRHGEPLMRYLVSMLHDRDAAEDAFQETWIQVIRKIRSCDPDRPFAPWLFRVARNLAYDELRRRRRRRFFSLDEPTLRVRPDPRSDPSAAVARLSAEDLSRKLMSRLEAPHRELIWLRFHRECSYEEISEICGIPLGTVKSRLRRALDRLGALYETTEAGNEEEARS